MYHVACAASGGNPLEIDGYRLGVAAIEGINRVTQGTGRIQLNL